MTIEQRREQLELQNQRLGRFGSETFPESFRLKTPQTPLATTRVPLLAAIPIGRLRLLIPSKRQNDTPHREGVGSMGRIFMSDGRSGGGKFPLPVYL